MQSWSVVMQSASMCATTVRLNPSLHKNEVCASARISQNHTVQSQMQAGRHWVVVGSGPCGIGSVGRLLDHGARVTWIDPSFLVGRMGKFYRGVPANTLNGDLITGFQLSPSLEYEKSQALLANSGKRTMNGLSRDVCYDLGVFVETLEAVQDILIPKTNAIVGMAEVIRRNADEGSWDVVVRDRSGIVNVHCDTVLICCGAVPAAHPSLPSPGQVEADHWHLDDRTVVHDLDRMVDPCYLHQLLQDTVPQAKEQVWAVVGNSHSAMLVMKNLHDCGVRRIVNYHRSDVKFMHQTAEGWARYQGVGLKGPAGVWARSVYLKSEDIQKVRIASGADLRALLKDHDVAHCVVAIGYTRSLGNLRVLDEAKVQLTEAGWDSYDRMTGEVPLPSSATSPTTGVDGSGVSPSISANSSQSASEQGQRRCSGLFGGGIAFPQDLIDGGGSREPWVGFKRSIEQVDIMVGAMQGAG